MSMNIQLKRWILRSLVGFVLVGLLYWALRNAPLLEILAAVRQLRPWQGAVILGLSIFFFGVSTLRWWVIVSAENRHVTFWPLLRVRFAVFGVSYFTLGPQVGGEALQVLVLRRKYGLSFTRATASVLLDKLLEFLMDFLLLAFGLASVLQGGVLIENGMQLAGSLLLLVFLIAWPPFHLLLLFNRRYPLTAILRMIPFLPKNAKLVRFVRAAEHLSGLFCQRYPRRLLVAIFCSVLAGAGMLLDYALVTSFLHIPLPFWKVVAGWWMGWVALLMPLPGGLGAMEASQVFALGQFGFSPAAALSVALVLRGRDMLLGGLGLLLTGLESTGAAK